MATVIRLQRAGRKKRPFYSVVVMDSRRRRDGAFIEKLGYYDPCRSPEVLKLDLERIKAWQQQGAQVSPRVASMIRKVETAQADTAAAKAAAKAEEASANVADASGEEQGNG